MKRSNMVARACGHSSEELLALGFAKKEVAKWQRIASRYRRRLKPEPDPGPWLERYRKKIADGWTWKSKRPADVDPKIWVKYQNFASTHRVAGTPIPDVYAYIKYYMGDIGGNAYKRRVSSRRKKGGSGSKSVDVKAIAARCWKIVAAKLREQGLSLPPKNLTTKR